MQIYAESLQYTNFKYVLKHKRVIFSDKSIRLPVCLRGGYKKTP